MFIKTPFYCTYNYHNDYAAIKAIRNNIISNSIHIISMYFERLNMTRTGLNAIDDDEHEPDESVEVVNFTFYEDAYLFGAFLPDTDNKMCQLLRVTDVELLADYPRITTLQKDEANFCYVFNFLFMISNKDEEMDIHIEKMHNDISDYLQHAESFIFRNSYFCKKIPGDKVSKEIPFLAITDSNSYK